MRAFLDREVAVSTLDRRLASVDVSSVTGNDIAGGELAAAHLLDLGHTQIAVVNGPDAISWSRDRRVGARHAIERHGRTVDSTLTEFTIPDLTASLAEAVVPDLVAAFPGGVAILCGNDLVALGVLRGLTALGRSVPDEYSLIGYDDVEFASVLSPALTTLRQESFKMGQRAASILFAPGVATEHVVFEPVLVERASTRPHD